MTVVFQGAQVETAAVTLAAFLAERAVDSAKAIVECAGEVYAPGSDLSSVVLKPGAAIDVFRIAAGG